ncbi:hypothetical protein FGG08_000428 [Glutinoglossum americanum]|uniref:Methyltransferase n=1 Tax=Glutinoglossum americanum TaxID=1670608 RepID=A0A9P8L6U5_9PEZI|nr:hypothetical protein FGG08_000428 [Glutinoglossum americanum]
MPGADVSLPEPNAEGAIEVESPGVLVPRGSEQIAELYLDSRTQDDTGDGDSALGVDLLSETTSIASSVRKYKYAHSKSHAPLLASPSSDGSWGGGADGMARYENGRRYHSFREGSYVLVSYSTLGPPARYATPRLQLTSFEPNDETEQERLDLVHHLFRLAIGGQLFRAPIGSSPQSVLDIGTGTDNDHQKSRILTRFARVPPNVNFEVDDAEADWTFPPNHFDFIHARTMGGSIADMDKLLAQCYKHLKPGGWVEIDEAEAWAKSDDGSLTPQHAMVIWQGHLDEASTSIGRKLNIADTIKAKIEAAGFEDVKDDIYKCPMGTWPKDKRLKELGLWGALSMLEGLEPYSLALLTRVLKWDRARIEVTLADVRNQINDRRIHSYFSL